LNHYIMTVEDRFNNCFILTILNPWFNQPPQYLVLKNLKVLPYPN
jgi:hypothetical protein